MHSMMFRFGCCLNHTLLDAPTTPPHKRALFSISRCSCSPTLMTGRRTRGVALGGKPSGTPEHYNPRLIAIVACLAAAQATSLPQPSRHLAQASLAEAPPPASAPIPLTNLPATSFNGSTLDALVSNKQGVYPGGPPVSVALNPQYDACKIKAGKTAGKPCNYGPILPWTDASIGKQVPGCAPEQVHLAWYATQDSGPAVLVSWATCDGAYKWEGADADTPAPALSTAAANSTVWVGSAVGVYDQRFDGTSFSYTMDYTKTLNGSAGHGGSYVSPILHHTLVTGLSPGAQYFYMINNAPQVAGGTSDGAPFHGSFKVPGGGFPVRIGVGGDAGQVTNVTASLEYSVQAQPDVFMFVGDWTYANRMDLDYGTCFTDEQCAYLTNMPGPGDRSRAYASTFAPRWDAMGRLLQPLASRVPFLGAVGNHETEPTPSEYGGHQYPEKKNGFANDRFFTRFANYLARYPNPSTAAVAKHGPSVADLAATTPASADQGRGLYYVSEIPAVATIITLSTYNYDDTYTATDKQYVWLKSVLARVDRAKTPWLIVQMHTGFYSLANHWLEAECARQIMEPLFRLYSVDLVFNGHTHDYQRAGPMYNYKRDDECGTQYITVGSYGTNEGVTVHWIDDNAKTPHDDYEWKHLFKSCTPASATSYSPPSSAPTAPGQWGEGGRCVAQKINASGQWCPTSQPDWSRWREHAYGVGMLDLLSPTKAVWAFHSQEAGMSRPVDEIVFTRADPATCAKSAATVAAARAVGGGATEVAAPAAPNVTAAVGQDT